MRCARTIIVVALVGSCATAGRALARTLTFEEAVSAREAVERVYYSHQLGATVPFEVALPREALEGKVRRSIEKGADIVITDAMLREEAERMAANSTMPDRLREIRAALGDDPVLFEECVVRPALVERLSRPLGAHDGEAPSSQSLCLPDDSWSNGSLASGSPLVSREQAELASIWTGSVMMIWGGSHSQPPGSVYPREGGIYDPALDTWTLMSTTGAPAGRDDHTAVWTGTELIVWGGDTEGVSSVAVSNTGGRYNPLTDSWTRTSTIAAPAARAGHVAVWTGSSMVIWGGRSAVAYLTSGGRYDPLLDKWTSITTFGAPEGGYGQRAFWSGDEMLVWTGSIRGGGRYDPLIDAWAPISIASAPARRHKYSAVWTGTQMILFGGLSVPAATSLSTGARYDADLDTWTVTSAIGVQPRSGAAAVWTGQEMLVWGGSGAAQLAGGARYDPASNTWAPMSEVNAPQENASPLQAVWTGGLMIVWGTGASRTQGGRYALGHATDDDHDGFTECEGDCNDGNLAVHPGAPEACNDQDNDCDGARDFDADGDRFLACRNDCDDTDAAVHPGAIDVCDGIDNDCSAVADDAAEICDGVDNDCDGPADEGVATQPIRELRFATRTSLTWPQPASVASWDVVRGSLNALRSSAGNFTNSLQLCVEDDHAASTISDTAQPSVGQGLYYLVRGEGCGLDGSYDGGGFTQLGSRDVEIAASPVACP